MKKPCSKTYIASKGYTFWEGSLGNICVDAMAKYFNIPKQASRLHIRLSHRASPDAYYLTLYYSSWQLLIENRWPVTIAPSFADGLASFMDGAHSCYMSVWYEVPQ